MSFLDLSDYDAEGPLHELFKNQVKRTPNKVAVIDHDKRCLTFSELNNCTDILANYLMSKGVIKGSIVGVLLERSLEWTISYIAIHKAGGAYLPLETSYPPPLLKSVLDDSKPCIVITKKKYIERVEETNVEKIELENDWLKSMEKENKKWPIKTLPVVSLDDTAYLVYSSGTTGKPKGIVCPHRGAVHAYKWRHRAYPYEEDDREGCNVFFVWEMLRPLLKGIPLYIISDTDIYDPPKLTKFIEEKKITRILFTPSLLETVVTYKGINVPKSFKTLKIIIFCGEVLTTNVRDQISNLCPWIKLLNLYSISECHDVSSADVSNPMGIKEGRKYCSVGKALPFVHILTLDENFSIKKFGEPGNIYIGGPTLAIGYLNLPELNKSKFIETPQHLRKHFGGRLYNTGDWGYALGDGTFEIIGRSDTMVKIRGYTVELQAIEVVLRDFPTVKSSCVICFGEEGQNQILVAYIVSTDSIKPSVLRSYLKTRFPYYMIPSKFFFLDHLPILKSSGKLNKKEMPKLDENCDIELDETMSDTERKLATLWCRILNLFTIEKDENFFDLGGHSLAAANCVGQMNDIFLCDLAIPDLFSHPTVESIASLMENKSKQGERVDLKNEIKINTYKNSDDRLSSKTQLFWKAIQINRNKLSQGNVLLTGATGYLGIHLLEKLLTQTKCTMYLTIRKTPNKTIAGRIIDNFKKYNIELNIDDYFDRIVYVESDLSLDILGFKTEEEYTSLSFEIDIIIHAAAYVNLVLPYNALYKSNVLATRNLIQFSFLNKIKYFHYISTDGIYPLTGNHFIENYEVSDMDLYLKKTNGYGQTKFVSEQLVLNAGHLGLPITIIRCGNIGGSLEFRNWNLIDSNLFMLEAIIESEYAPDVNWNFEFTPMDFLTKSLIKLYTNISNSNKIYNFVNTKPIHIRKLVNLINSLGHNIEFMPYEEWIEKIKTMNKLQLAIQLASSNGKYWLDTNNTYSVINTQNFLKTNNETYPTTDDTLIKEYFNIWTKIKLSSSLNSKRDNSKEPDKAKSILNIIDNKVNITFENNLLNKVIFITGCSSGIGEQLVKDLVPFGARIIAVARRIDRLDKLKVSLKEKSKNVIVKKLDVTNENDVRKSVHEVFEEFGRIDILINNAGVMYFTLVEKSTFEEWNRMVDVNIKGVLNCIGNILPRMIQSKQPGHIVNVSSNAGVRPFSGIAVYTGSKYFIEGFSGALRQEVSSKNIKITCIQPGDIKTELITHSTDLETLQKYDISDSGIPLLTVEDVSKSIVYSLLQPSNSAVNSILIEPPLASI